MRLDNFETHTFFVIIISYNSIEVRCVCLRMMLFVQRFCVYSSNHSLCRFASVDVIRNASAEDRSEILRTALHRFTSVGTKASG